MKEGGDGGTMPKDARPIDVSLPARLREFHERFPLVGDPPNAILSLPDDQVLYLVALLRGAPVPDLGPEEWRHLLDLLAPHHVYPFLSYHLRSWPGDCRPPKEVRDVLDRAFLAGSGRAMQAGRQLQAMVDALESAGIPSAVLKGPALARTVYPHPALRQSQDIDLLVRRADVPAAEAVLEGLGYVSPKREFHTQSHAYHQEFHPPSNGAPLELHWSLDCGYRLVRDSEGWVEKAIERRVPIASPDLRAHTLAPADHLPYLGLHHGFQHEGLRLDQVADVSRLVAEIRDPAEWDGLVRQAQEGGLLLPLRFATEATALWGGLELPGEYTDPDAAERTVSRDEARLWGHMKARQSSPASTLVTAVHRERGMVNKVRCGCRFILPAEAILKDYRRSGSAVDVPLAHLRRWLSWTRYLRSPRAR